MNLPYGYWVYICIIGVIVLIILASSKEARDFVKTVCLIAIAYALVQIAMK